MNLEKTTYSREMVEQFFERKMNVVLRSEHAINKGMDFSAFADGIAHPRTGEHLKAVKGYADNNGKFYYVEYENKAGEKFSYMIGSNNENIKDLIYNDSYAQKRAEFSDFMSDKGEFQTIGEDHNITNSQNYDYYDSQSNNSNDNNVYDLTR